MKCVATKRCKVRVAVTAWDGATLCQGHAKERADKAVRAFVLQRDESCQRCGAVSQLQWSHHITRSILATRWWEFGSCIHCAGCHVRLTHHPTLHAEWVETYLGVQRFAELKDRAYGPIDPYTGTRSGPIRTDVAEIIRTYEERAA